jgi:cytochrome c peroxidase
VRGAAGEGARVSRRRRIAAWAVAAVSLVAAAAVLVALAGDDGPDRPAFAHSRVGEVPADQLGRVLDAAEAASTAATREELEAEGRALFRDQELSRSGESCESCHVGGGGANAELGTIAHPRFEGDFRGPRDVPSLWGVGRTGPWGWDGRTADLASFVTGTLVDHFRGGPGTPEVAGRRVAALTAYLRSLQAPRTAFDQGTLSPAARRGEDLFQGKGGCIACHGGPDLTDNQVQATGVPKVSPADTDPGAARTGPLAGAFNTPQLRDLRNTAPYMHNGSLRTLREVVDFYNTRSTVSPLRLTGPEVDDLVAYLDAL